MTLTEAWTELGVEPGADAETVRRAYLRLIKTRKPESDPVGFQRARAAFEVARADGEIESLAAESERRHAPAFSGAPGGMGGGRARRPRRPREPRRAPASRTATSSSKASGARGKASAVGGPAAASGDRPRGGRRPPPRSARALVARLHAVAPGPRDGAGRRAARRMARGLPRIPRGAAGAAADQGVARGDRRRLRVAGAGGQARGGGRRGGLGRAARRRAGGRAVPRRRWRRRSTRATTTCASCRCCACWTSSWRCTPPARSTPPRRPRPRCARCLHDSGLELALAQGPLGGVWTLTEEIGGLPREFPRPLRTAFAYATRAGDLTSAYIDTCRAIELDRSEVSLWASKLAASAPNVSGIMQTALSNTRAEAARTRRLPVLAAWMGADPDVSRVRTAVHVFRRHRHGRPSRPSRSPPASTLTSRRRDRRPFAPGPPPGSVSISWGRGRRPVRPRADRDTGSSSAPTSRPTSRRCARGECGALPERLTRIKRALPADARGERDRRFFSRVTIARWQACGSGGQAESESGTP